MIKNRKEGLILLLFVLCFLFASCGSHKNLVYIQETPIDTEMEIQKVPELIIQPQDMLSIVVSSKTPELAAPFNLPIVTYQGGTEVLSSQQRLLGYVVDTNGEIDFPVLGKIYISGLTREQISVMIKDKLISEDYINDPVITVQFMNFRVHVLGEVAKPGTYTINGDHITLMEALSLAGDLTVYGKRENVKVVREKNGERIVYMIDLRSTDIFSSPAYYMQQNDIIYIEPNKYKARQSTNTNQFTQVSLWVSIVTMIVTIITLTK